MDRNTGLTVYLLFVISWFLHSGARLPVLGLIRFDLLLICILSYLAFLSKEDTSNGPRTETDKLLRTLVMYAVLTIPFVQWPGSVINVGIPNFIKGIVFYYFTIAFVRTEKDLKKFVFVFIVCQLWRIVEPLYLHITQGYWGSAAHMVEGEFMYRLSGAPSDVVNPNGLAFIICTVLPFLYLSSGLSWQGSLAFILFTPICIYTLLLTASRSGILGFVIIFLGILVKSKRRFLWTMSGVLLVVVGFPFLSPDMQDRYLSIIGKGDKNAATAEGRWTGTLDSFVVAFRKPIFGHGLGTSQEANANFGGSDQPAHNLYAEVAQELGFVGLAILIPFLKSIFSGFTKCKRAYQDQDASVFSQRIVDALQLFLIMNFIFSFASYGLSSYEWYLLGGFSVVMQRLASATLTQEATRQIS